MMLTELRVLRNLGKNKMMSAADFEIQENSGGMKLRRSTRGNNR